ncbi:hypothetical protein AVU18_gp089 [Citrobacter phage IME-CF2]|uniref:Uncharacterized protein n=5 Tax=Pseudotevenvirus TaxID=2842979 RepID=Q56BT6_9CAUD|nr:hypothetical protein RB16p103 [Escherichia phage RB16]YP_009097716.1 hypothetical protein CPTMiller_00114 [Citrobacter phage Miller]YP_009218627.1 hypothetical protein AVU18_gp089 [Citrobacter phage IME-CF2]YP_239088.1 hypothetical protein RB43ORF112c [Escherichia phage RB43]QPX73028.1 hypothetical protein [Citrobacter phage vB_Cfr_Xman]CCK73961.1 protein of unknown function [Pseudotevenvirus RB43]AAX78634.1 hypothetical protein RB43ORF112c [Escherichia phage RB43]ADJ55407.1 conserved hyp
MNAKMKFVKDWRKGAVIGESYIIVDIESNPIEGFDVLEVPRYGMIEAAEQAERLNGYVLHIIEAIEKELA